MKADGQNLTNLRFADDVILVGEKKEIQTMGEELFQLSLEARMVANIQKTKIMNSGNKKLII